MKHEGYIRYVLRIVITHSIDINVICISNNTYDICFQKDSTADRRFDIYATNNVYLLATVNMTSLFQKEKDDEIYCFVSIR